MCVIIAKNKTNRLPEIEEVRQCYKNNNDGAGFMYTLNGNVIIDKGYMDEEKFVNRFKYLCKRFNNFDNKCLVIHCRIGTAGTNSAQNTHPYPITNSINDLHKLYYRCKLGMAHNGIISNYNPSALEKDKDINDTQNFIIKYIYELYSNWKSFYKNNNMIDAIKNISNSKFAILDGNDNLITIGNFEEHKGLLFSNNSYQKKTYTYSYKYGNDYYWDKWYDAYNYNHSYTQKATTKTTSYINIPASYNLYFGGNVVSGNDYYLNDDGDLLKYNEDSGKYEYLSSNFTIFDSNFEEVEVNDLLGV